MTAVLPYESMRFTFLQTCFAHPLHDLDLFPHGFSVAIVHDPQSGRSSVAGAPFTCGGNGHFRKMHAEENHMVVHDPDYKSDSVEQHLFTDKKE